MKREEEILKAAAAEIPSCGDMAEPERSAFLAGANWADENPKNPWHHIGDQMPKDREKIFFCKKDGAMYYGWFDERMQCFLTIDPDCTKWTINGVTHWMPIPEIKK